MNLYLSVIRIDGDTQARVAVNEEVVRQYSERMAEGEKFPAIIIFHDGSDYWLADGYHRYFAAKKLDMQEIEAEIETGTVSDAMLYAFGANSKRGLSMSDDDIRNVIRRMLEHEEWGKWSNNAIGRHVGVSSMTVGRVKASMQGEKETKKTYINKQGNKGVMDTRNIGRKKILPETPEEPDNKVNEMSEALLECEAENQSLKDKISIGNWDASEIEKIDIQEVVEGLREQIRVLEIDNKSLRESRDMYQSRNAEMIKTISSLKAKNKKLEQK
jgi:hypothetical protein